MKKSENVPIAKSATAPRSPLRPWLVLGTSIAVLAIMAGFVFLLRQTPGDLGVQPNVNAPAATSPETLSTNAPRRFGTAFPTRAEATAASSPEQIVAARVNRFAASRRKVMRDYAEELKVAVPAEYEKFFDFAEAGNWAELHALFLDLKERRQHGEMDSTEQARLWSALFETHGVAEIAHGWPAQELLDYGHSVLGALRPGMIYLGGTDAGRFIPTLLNETDGGERHVIFTQNALADATYLQYAEFLYRDQLNVLTPQDSEKAFSSYMEDAAKRFRHDQDFPHEQKQLRPGEDVRWNDNRVQVSGQVAVMAINERLVQALMDKNPNASFAMEESFPFNSAYAQATPLGPLLELRAAEVAGGISAERASMSAEYWRSTTQELLAQGVEALSSDTRDAYSKMLSAQAGLLAAQQHGAEAEQIFRLATNLTPSHPEPVFRLVELLMGQQRVGDAIEIVQRATGSESEAKPSFEALLAHLRQLKTQNAN